LTTGKREGERVGTVTKKNEKGKRVRRQVLWTSEKPYRAERHIYYTYQQSFLIYLHPSMPPSLPT
jgi:hypothetical protein